MPKATKATKQQRHTPLHVELDADDSVRRFGRVTAPGKRKKREKEEEEEEAVSIACGLPGRWGSGVGFGGLELCKSRVVNLGLWTLDLDV